MALVVVLASALDLFNPFFKEKTKYFAEVVVRLREDKGLPCSVASLATPVAHMFALARQVAKEEIGLNTPPGQSSQTALNLVTEHSVGTTSGWSSERHADLTKYLCILGHAIAKCEIAQTQSSAAAQKTTARRRGIQHFQSEVFSFNPDNDEGEALASRDGAAAVDLLSDGEDNVDGEDHEHTKRPRVNLNGDVLGPKGKKTNERGGGRARGGAEPAQTKRRHHLVEAAEALSGGKEAALMQASALQMQAKAALLTAQIAAKQAGVESDI
jgi:hypothetical protein